MAKEEKQLLLKVLCGYLPYDLYVANENKVFRAHNIDVFSEEVNGINIEKIKPYLRPMSSMTEEEIKEYKHLAAFSGNPDGASNWVDWLNKHHFDYRGLIEKGLALSALEGMYN